MNFRNIEYFIAITEENSITKAAERLHISQQSLSEQLRKLEDEVGAPLIKRGQPMTLTPAGMVFFHAASEMLLTHNEMLNEIAAISQKRRTMLTLAVPTTEVPLFLPGLLTDFSQNHPEYEVKLVQYGPKDAAKNAGSFDLYFSALPLPQELDNIPIAQEDTYAVAFSESLARRVYGRHWEEVEAQLVKTRDIYAIREMPFIFLRNKLYDIVLDRQAIFEAAGFTPHIAFQSENSELNFEMCRLGNGVYVATMDNCRRYLNRSTGQREQFLLYPIDSCINPVVVALSYRKGKRLTKADNCFIESAKQYLRDHPSI